MVDVVDANELNKTDGQLPQASVWRKARLNLGQDLVDQCRQIPLHQLDQQVFLRGEVLVEGGAANFGLGGDVCVGCLRVSELAKEPRCGIEELILASRRRCASLKASDDTEGRGILIERRPLSRFPADRLDCR